MKQTADSARKMTPELCEKGVRFTVVALIVFFLKHFVLYNEVEITLRFYVFSGRSPDFAVLVGRNIVVSFLQLSSQVEFTLAHSLQRRCKPLCSLDCAINRGSS